MAKLSRDAGVGTLHPRETLYATGLLAAAGAEIIVPCDGCASFAVDLRGTYVLSIEVAGTVDGTNWIPIPIRRADINPVGYVLGVALSSPALYVGACLAFRQVRVRCTSYTSGAASTVLSASSAPLDQSLVGQVTTQLGTTTGAAGAAVTLTLAAPGTGLRHYVTYLSINRFAAAALTASATPVVVTTTNLPGSLAFTFEADSAALGTMTRWREDFTYPLTASLQNTATTIVCPATTGVIWRVTAGYYVAP